MSVRVFIATSLDGFIAGPGGELDWLEEAESPEAPSEGALHFGDFFAQVGAVLMGRASYEAVRNFEPWPYLDRAVLVASHRPLASGPLTVRAVSGEIAALIEEAKKAAGEKDVYLDGGHLIRQGLEAGLVDELVVTQVPVMLGSGLPLFAGLGQRQRMEIVESHRYAGRSLQLKLRPRR